MTSLFFKTREQGGPTISKINWDRRERELVASKWKDLDRASKTKPVKVIEAKYQGTCKKCHDYYGPGTKLWYSKMYRGWIHDDAKLCVTVKAGKDLSAERSHHFDK